MLKVVLIEDSPLLCRQLGDALADLPGIRLVGTADEEDAAVDLLMRQHPDLAIVDLQLRRGSGLGLLRAIAASPERFGAPRTVVFTSHQHAGIRSRCLALGVERIFDKGGCLEELLAYVRAESAP